MKSKNSLAPQQQYEIDVDEVYLSIRSNVLIPVSDKVRLAFDYYDRHSATIGLMTPKLIVDLRYSLRNQLWY